MYYLEEIITDLPIERVAGGHDSVLQSSSPMGLIGTLGFIKYGEVIGKRGFRMPSLYPLQSIIEALPNQYYVSTLTLNRRCTIGISSYLF